MGKLIIEESPPLKGTVRIGGAKNSVLPILAGTLLTDEECVIRDVPPLTDVTIMQKLIEHLGAKSKWDIESGLMKVNCSKINKYEAPYELVGKMRASFLVMGPLLARLGKAKMALPGGCQIGARPVELHLKGFSALGAKVEKKNGFVEAKAKELIGSNIYLDFPSVGATENIMMAAVLAKGQTVIQNCAVEPEIVDLANFLTSIGADIRGTGTDTIKINGVEKLTGGDYTVIPDRIEAGTFMVAAAITKGDIILENVVLDHLKPVIAKLREANVNVEESEAGLRVYVDQSPCSIDIKTLPYPGFPTDMQAQLMALLILTEGTSVVTETIFENRFMHAAEFKRMGADILVEGRVSVVEGVKKLTGTQVRATDLRAGAGLILAGLRASGMTEISDIYHIDRGYSHLDKKLKDLGAKITRIDD